MSNTPSGAVTPAPFSHISSADRQLRLRAALVSVGVGVTLLILKFAAYVATGSTAVLSDALESIINVVASLFALFSIIVSVRPADESHPYGHGKVEFFAAAFEGALIVLAALGILWTAVPRLLDPVELQRLDLGLLLLVVGGAVNYLLGTYLIRAGTQAKSDALVADGRHVHTDAYTSFAVIVGLFLVRLTGWLRLDPIVACVMAVNILFTGRRLIRQSTAGLMDESDPHFLARVAEALDGLQQPGWIAPHHLRARRAGAVWHIDFHLVLPRFWDLSQCHDVQVRIEPELLSALDEPGQVLVHFDPCNAAYCGRCSLEGCPIRSEPYDGRVEWRVEDLVGDPPFPRVLPEREDLASWA